MKQLFLLILVTQIAFSQKGKMTLEDNIYNAVDVFVANPNVESLRKLEIEENKFKEGIKKGKKFIKLLQENLERQK
mgnify:CR=1 FL=1